MENATRVANGMSALKIDENIMRSAQDTAETMAYYKMGGHIGNVKDHISSFGYNNYYECWATENWWNAAPGMTLADVKAVWGDAAHMIPAENPLYCHIGAGVAEAADGTLYFVLQAAYPAHKAGCSYLLKKNADAHGLKPISATIGGGTFSGSNLIYAVQTVLPDGDGKTYHVVKQGQALAHIAAAYHTTIDALINWNQIKVETPLQLGQKLFIPSAEMSAQKPTVQPTILPTMSEDGKFRHVVAMGETLWTIAELWQANLEDLYAVNGLDEKSTINIGWKLFIPVTPTLTKLPTASPSPQQTQNAATETTPSLTVQPSGTPEPAVFQKKHATPGQSAAFIAVLATLSSGILICILFMIKIRRK